MADDLAENLANYKLQLQQVEAALTTDPDNEDLVKLRSDLQEVINLTQELVNGQLRTSGRLPPSDSESDEEGESERLNNQARAWLATDWKTGDRCRAVWSEDQQYYSGTIDEILDDGTCSVIFDKYGSTEVTKISFLKPCNDEDDTDGPSASKKPKTKYYN